MADFNPAPKPSKRSGTGEAATPAKDDAKSGVVTWSPETLRKDDKKRQALIESPEGTLGRDMAVAIQGEIDRAKAAAPIVTAAVKDAKEWDQLHGKAATVTKRLADKLAQLRMVYVDAKGNPDMIGRSNEYREAAASIYQKAGFDSGKAASLQSTVRYHLGTSVRELLQKDERFANGEEAKYKELCGYYGINPTTAADRQKDKRAAAGAETQLPALKVAADDAVKLWKGAAEYAHKALEVPGDADPGSLPPKDRAALRKELEAIQTRAATILELLGDPEDDEDA